MTTKADIIRSMSHVSSTREIAEAANTSIHHVHAVRWQDRNPTKIHTLNRRKHEQRATEDIAAGRRLPRHGHWTSYWTPDKDAEMTRLIDSGKSFTEVAQIMGVGRGAICARVYRLRNGVEYARPWTAGEDRELRELAKAGLGVTDIARILGRKALGVTARASVIGGVSFRRASKRITWTPERDEMLRQLLKKGLTVDQCAIAIGCSFDAAYIRMRRLERKCKEGGA